MSYMENSLGPVGRGIGSPKGRDISCCDFLEMENNQNPEYEEERKTFLETIFSTCWLIGNGAEKRLERRTIVRFLHVLTGCRAGLLES